MKTARIFVDHRFVTDDGEPSPGADVYETYYRVHPQNKDELINGLKMFLGFEDVIEYFELEDIFNETNTDT